MKFPRFLVFFAWCCLFAETAGAAAPHPSLENEHIRADFTVTGNAMQLSQLSRKDGSNALHLNADDVFEIVLFDKRRFTAADYSIGKIESRDGLIKVDYRRLDKTDAAAPDEVSVTYTMGSEPWLFKDVDFKLPEGEKIDRLGVLRFSSKQAASRGGHGQPIFIGDWFFGLNYPCFYSRHSDGFVEPAFHYVWHYTIDLEGGDAEYAPRDGLVSLFHFPGFSKQQQDGTWGISGKQAVIGIAAKRGDNAELGLLDYIEAMRRPNRSYLHFNNWYTEEAKEITVDAFVKNVATKLKSNLERYGAKLDGMVPDDRWQKRVDITRIYEPLYPMHEVSAALREMGIDFGIWLALDGTTNKAKAAEKAGYKIANPGEKQKQANGKMRTVYPPNYQKRVGYWGPQQYFDILDPKWQKDLREALRYLMQDCDVRYIKHDFNHMFTSDHLSERHAREACLDATLDLIAYERELSPQLLVNFTNGTFFTPFYLLFTEYIWMNSGDHGKEQAQPQLSALENATSYRDSHFYRSFNNPEAVVRPVIPIANFMTHGILHSGNVKYYDPAVDPIRDWLNYVVFYYGRGTLLKELYISPDDLNEEMWKALGTASAWAQHNQDALRNTVYIGGDPGKGEVYGYISWQGDKAILTVRNPDRRLQRLEVPFDSSVYFRGGSGLPFHARAIYPFVEQMPWQLVSGEPFAVEVPGDSVLVYELSAGAATATSQAIPEPLPAVTRAHSDKDGFAIELTIPDEAFPHYELILNHGIIGNKQPAVPTINGVPVSASRRNPPPPRRSPGPIITGYDLRPYRGQTIRIEGRTPHADEQVSEAWLTVDRTVSAAPDDRSEGEILPWSIGQTSRRITTQLLPDGASR